MKLLDKILGALTLDEPVVDIRICAFWTVVVLGRERRRAGLASNLSPDHQPGKTFVRDCGRLLEYSARELAELVRSESPLEAGVGMATVNALLDVDESRFVESNASELILERGRGKKVAVVGHFPFVPAIKAVADTCWVLEQRPQHGDIHADQAREVLPQADVVALTGTSVMNHTFENLMSLCSPSAYVVVLGPSTPMLPLLFDYGVDVVSGAQVTDVDCVLRYVSQGATFKQIEGVRLLNMLRQ